MSPESYPVDQIREVKKNCLELLLKIAALCPVDASGHRPEAFRLIATPMLYAVWERCFTLCQSISLRMIRDECKHTRALTSVQRALWLQCQPFYQRFLDQIRTSTAPAFAKRVKRGPFNALSEFMGNFDEWMNREIDNAINTDDLVISFSNVNPDVVRLNAAVIGIEEHHGFKKLDFGRLHDLVGRRNEIGHGGIVNIPGNREFSELWVFTENLVTHYCDSFSDWILSRPSNVESESI